MYEVAVYNDQQHEQFTCLSDRFALRESSSGRWVPVWDQDEQPRAGDLRFFVIENTLSVERSQYDLQLADGRELPDGESLRLPCLLRVGATWLEITDQQEKPGQLVPLKQTNLEELFAEPSMGKKYAGPSSTTVTKWLTEAGQLHRAAAGSAEFYADAARFAVESVGLDAAWVLSRSDDGCEDRWQIAGSFLPHPERGVRFDKSSLEILVGQTVAWYQPSDAEEADAEEPDTEESDAEEAPQTSQAIVIAPVLDANGKLVAAIYGVRDTLGLNRRRGVRPLEARLVQLLAESVAVGIARLQQETEAARTRVLLEHAFSPTMAEYIQRHPESLAGQQRDVTLLFADLRGYTTLAETMRPTDCYDLLGEVMEALTQVVMHQRGIVVDYYGDGLLALWNAPLEQPNHADLACSAAIEMFEALPPVAAKWRNRLSGPLELGIGIHSGPAYVGNAGTRSRLKYGPRGNTVNVASRVQAASKQLQLPLVITSETQTKLSEKFFTLRVCTAKLPGLEKPAELFTAYPASVAARIQSRLDQYSQALALFEAGAFEEAEALLSHLVSLGQATPAHFLAHYATAQKNSNLGRRAIDKHAASQGSVIEILTK